MQNEDQYRFQAWVPLANSSEHQGNDMSKSVPNQVVRISNDALQQTTGLLDTPR